MEVNFESVKNHYETLQRDNEAELLKRREHVFQIIPQLVPFEIKLEELYRKLPLSSVKGNDADLLREIDALELEKGKLLSAAGLDASTLALRYHCEKCRDTGYLDELKRQMCPCMNELIKKFKVNQNGMGRIPEQTFSNFNINVFKDQAQRKQMQSVKEYFLSYAESFPHTESQNILLIGKAGHGKTFLLNCVHNYLANQGEDVVFLSSFKLSEQLFKKHTSLDDRSISEFTCVSLLIIDDLGSEPLINNVTLEYYLAILNERIENKKHTIIATNLYPEKLMERYDGRIASRLLDSSITDLLLLEGKDIRPTLKK